jgi:hypothetical protein
VLGTLISALQKKKKTTKLNPKRRCGVQGKIKVNMKIDRRQIDQKI